MGRAWCRGDGMESGLESAGSCRFGGAVAPAMVAIAIRPATNRAGGGAGK